MKLRKVYPKLLAAKRVLKNEGSTTLAIKVLAKAQNRKRHSAKHSSLKSITMLVKPEDVIEADWTDITKLPQPRKVKDSTLTINWVMSPPGKGSGGHQNIFRFIRFLEQAGHVARVYLYSAHDHRSIDEIKEVLKDSYPKTSAIIEWLEDDMEPASAVFATGWETAYPVFNSECSANKFYFVQDFEPYFYPVGSESILAENTYRFGFYGITAGGWLAKKLHEDYGMDTDYFNFGAEKSLYKLSNQSPRKEIFFYARPVTARRGFEIGLMALEIFHKQNPDYTINLAGWDVSDYQIPFPYKNLKTLTIQELSAVYNRCSAALVMSLTNMSLLPLELLACGTIPVVNEGQNNRLVSDNPHIEYTPTSPQALANKLSEIVNKKDLSKHAKQASQSVETATWEVSGARFVELVEKRLHG